MTASMTITGTGDALQQQGELVTSSILDVLAPHWEVFQQLAAKSSKDNDAKWKQKDLSIVQSTVSSIRRDVHSFYKDTYTNNKKSIIQEAAIKTCLIHFFDCSIAAVLGVDNTVIDDENIVHTKSTISKEAIGRILQLTAAVTASDLISVPTCYEILQHAAQFAVVIVSENVRAAVCQWIGYLVQFIVKRESSSTYNDVLDMASQTLIPCFTDKSQIVRMTAIQGGANFFEGNDTTDPDILQAMLWALQHDPSLVNRYAACQSLPLNLETIDYILARIRDVKPKVRCMALERLQHAFLSSASILDPPQAAAAVVTGWTKRYVSYPAIYNASSSVTFSIASFDVSH
jgi:hypothetical protein